MLLLFLFRLLFYSDFGDRTDRHPAGISKANLDGTNIRVIISKKLVGPQGLSLDYVNQKIYWTDRSLDRIETADYNGQNRYVSLNVHLVKGMTSVPYLLQLIIVFNTTMNVLKVYYQPNVWNVRNTPAVNSNEIQISHCCL